MESPQRWRFARVRNGVLQWRLRRNCSVTPLQLLSLYGLLALWSLVIAMFFWVHGAPLVLPFTALELVAVGVAFGVYARHATDGEVIELRPEGLCVERMVAGEVSHHAFDVRQVRVCEPTSAEELIEIRSGQQQMWVGQYLRAEWRGAVVGEIRQALSADGVWVIPEGVTR